MLSLYTDPASYKKNWNHTSIYHIKPLVHLLHNFSSKNHLIQFQVYSIVASRKKNRKIPPINFFIKLE